MLGTPNRGSEGAYYVWEGGFVDGIGMPLILDMIVGYGSSLQPYQFIQQNILAENQLLPIDPYLYHDVNSKWVSIPIKNMFWQNDLIPTVLHPNSNLLISKLWINNIHIFAGTHLPTISKIHVTTPSPTASKYIDGEPSSGSAVYNPTGGDTSVLLSSAQLGSINVTKEPGVYHTQLPDKCKNAVVKFLTGKQVHSETSQETTESSAEEGAALQSLLFVGTRDNIHIGLTTTEGLRVGNFPFQEGRTAELENYYYRGDKKQTNAIGIYNPAKGEHMLSITTQEPKADYNIYVSYSDDEGFKSDTVKGVVTKDEVKTYFIKVDQKVSIE
jgi:hypothetical protein